MRKVLLCALGVALTLGLVVVLVAVNSTDEATSPPPQEKTTNLRDIAIPLPSGWRTKSEEGVTYAYKPPCTFQKCTNLAVFDESALAGGDWQKVITDTYGCQSNPTEAPDVPTPRGTRMIGDRGAYYYTMARCGVSNIEILGIWQTQIPPRLIVTQKDTSGLPDLEERLTRAHWTA